ncbi:MAG: hypothetical protein ACF8OB_18945 [Phycisphaeraceae bacterium JB051]
MNINEEVPSSLPEWDFYAATGGGYSRSNYSVDATGLKYKSKATSLWLATRLSKDRMSLSTTISYRSTKGVDAFSGSDSEYYGLRISPGYRLLEQDTQLINLDFAAIMDVGYQDNSLSGSQWRLSPGAKLKASMATKFGYFSGGYTFLNSRNIDGDTEVTGESFINIHTLNAGYAIPITENIYSGIGIRYMLIDDMPSDMPDEYLTLSGDLRCRIDENIFVSFNYHQDIEGSNNRGFGVSVGVNW